MDFADMLCTGPVYVHRFKGQYRCVWTPLKTDGSGGFQMHGIGLADQPYIAVARALAHAKEQGWRPAT